MWCAIAAARSPDCRRPETARRSCEQQLARRAQESAQVLRTLRIPLRSRVFVHPAKFSCSRIDRAQRIFNSTHGLRCMPGTTEYRPVNRILVVNLVALRRIQVETVLSPDRMWGRPICCAAVVGRNRRTTELRIFIWIGNRCPRSLTPLYQFGDSMKVLVTRLFPFVRSSRKKSVAARLRHQFARPSVNVHVEQHGNLSGVPIVGVVRRALEIPCHFAVFRIQGNDRRRIEV